MPFMFPTQTLHRPHIRTFSTTQQAQLSRRSSVALHEIKHADHRKRARNDARKRQDNTMLQALEQENLYLDLGLKKDQRATESQDLIGGPEHAMYKEALYEAIQCQGRMREMARARAQSILGKLNRGLTFTARARQVNRDLTRMRQRKDIKDESSARSGPTKGRRTLTESKNAESRLNNQSLEVPSLMDHWNRKQPLSSVQPIESQIRQLEERIRLEKMRPPSLGLSAFPKPRTAPAESKDTKLRSSTRTAWRRRKKEAAMTKRNEEMKKELEARWEADLKELEETLSGFKMHLENYKAGVDDQSGRLRLLKGVEPTQARIHAQGRRGPHEELTSGSKQSDNASISTPDTPFGETNNPTSAPASPQTQKEASAAAQSSLSDQSASPLPPSSIIDIDPSLTINIEAPVPELRSQIFQILERLKNAYPRIDSLPDDAWTSSNPAALRTWLRILVGKWQTRFDDIDARENPRTTDSGDKVFSDEVKAVLDEMVRDRDLDRESAEHMARRWEEVFERSGESVSETEVEAAAEFDQEEWDAAGWSWLEAEKERVAEVVQAPQKDINNYVLPADMSFSRQSRKNAGSRISGVKRYRTLASARHYSTSPRPPLDLNNPSSTKHAASTSDTDAKPTASAPASTTEQSLPHLTPSGSAHMVSVASKPHTLRTAIAVGTVHFSNPTPLSLIRSNSLKKGDVLSVSRIAGIMAAKKCPDLIPLCHPIALTHVGVELKPFEGGEIGSYGGIVVEAKVQCEGQTGVEMEALTSVMGACLSVVDMCKAVDKGMRVQDVRVVLKEGGRSGMWKEDGWRSVMD